MKVGVATQKRPPTLPPRHLVEHIIESLRKNRFRRKYTNLTNFYDRIERISYKDIDSTSVLQKCIV